MFSSTRAVIAAALTIVALTSFPALAADGVGAERVTGTTMPSVDFTLTSNATYIAGVAPSIPPSMLVDVLTAPAPAAPAAPLLAPSVEQRPIEMAMPRRERTSGATSLRRSMYLSFAALQVMDFVSTNKAISAGGVEANPAMSGIVKNRGAFMAVKAGTAAAAAFISEKIAKRHPRRATILMAVLNTAYAGIVAHNYRVARSNR